MVKKEVVKRIRKIKGRFRSRTPLSLNNPDTPAFVETGPAHVKGKPSQRQLIAFRTPPCTYGKCTMCGFGSGAVPSVTFDNLRAQLEAINLITEGRVSLCTESSFFHPKLPTDFLDFAFELISKTGIQEIDLESSATGIIQNIGKIERLKRILRPGQQLFVGMGLESHDDFVRNVLIRKETSLQVFEEAVSALASIGSGVYSYILLKPPGLREREAIEECINTVRYFFETAKRAGIVHSRATVKPLFIPEGTVVEVLFNEGLITTPKLWSLIEVLERVHHLGTIFVPLTDENVASGRLPGNCDRCTERVRKAISRFSADQLIEPLKRLYCSCKKEWEKRVNENAQ